MFALSAFSAKEFNLRRIVALQQPEQNPYPDSTMARDQEPPPSDFPPNSELSVDTRARNIVAALTELPKRFIEYINDNVAASTYRDLNLRLLTNLRTKISHRALT
jgi:hypothetical protein